MSREVSYAKQTLESPNPITRFAHQSRYRISLDLADRLLPKGGLMVDFGAGEGTLLHKFGQRRADARLLAIEPFMTIRYPEVRQLAKLGDAEAGSVDVVGSFEVLEHVSDADLEQFLVDAKRALNADGRLLITVPIMYGLALPVKELSRMVLHRRLSDTGPIEMVRATLGLPIERPTLRGPTHKGFDFRWLEQQIAKHFTILERGFSPFQMLPWMVNSQAIFIAGKLG